MRAALLPVLAITLMACAEPEQALVPTGRSVPDGILAARPVPNPGATFEYLTVAPSATGGRLIGDERDANGDPSVGSSVYDNGKCGVTAQIFVGGSGDATMDPIGDSTGGSTACSGGRLLTVEFGNPLGNPVGPALETAIGAHFTNVRDVHSLAPGAEGERRFRLLLRGFAGCDYLRYENEAGSDGRLGTTDDVKFNGITGQSILVTRLADTQAGKRVWHAVSQSNANGHVAFCEKVTKRGSTYVGAYDIPFDIIVTEK